MKHGKMRDTGKRDKEQFRFTGYMSVRVKDNKATTGTGTRSAGFCLD